MVALFPERHHLKGINYFCKKNSIKMFYRVVHTPLIFFCKTCKGTTINRITGSLQILILNCNFTQYYLHGLNPLPGQILLIWYFKRKKMFSIFFKWQKQLLQVFYKKAALEDFEILTGKYLCWSLFLIKLQAFRLATLLKRDSDTGVFLWILQNF